MTRFTLLLFVLAACGGSEAPTPAPVTAAQAAPEAKPEPKAEPAAAPAEAPADDKVAETGPADLAKGAETYTQYCQACHQADGSGMNSMLAANFKEDGRLDKSDKELLGSIRNGFQGKIGMMPPWKGTLSDQDMVNVLGHIRKTYGK